MVEEVHTLSSEPGVDRVIQDEALHYLHMVFPEGQGLPEHLSNSTVYMTVVRGRLSIRLNDQPTQLYAGGTLLKIPFQTRMNVRNLHPETLELIVLKAPAPKAMPSPRGENVPG